MSKRLPNSDPFAIDCHADEPVTRPPEVSYPRMLELSVTVWAEHQQVTWVMADLWLKMVYFKVRFTVRFFESEGTHLTPSIMQFTKQHANSRWDALVALGGSREYPRTRLA